MTSSPISPSLDPNPVERFFRGLWNLVKWFFGRKWLWIPTDSLIVLWIAMGNCFVYVPPGSSGLKQKFYGDDAGIKPEAYATGLHFIFPFTERMHLYPTDLQTVNFSDSASESSQEYRTAPSIRLQTSDGYQVQLDVSVLYRIQDPYKVFTESGPGRSFEDRLVIPHADRILRKTLGELNAEQFYQGPRRIEKAKNANDQLATQLSAYGIQVDAVLVRSFVYDGKYQEIIESRKIKDQTVFLRQAEAKAAIEERKRDTMVAEGRANVQVEISRGAAEVQKLKADADLYRRKRDAEGKLLVDLAEAKGTQLENEALEGAGSENMVGLKMAEALQGVRVLVLPSDGQYGVNPLDLGGMLRKFEVQ